VHKHAAFAGEFAWSVVDGQTMKLEWLNGDAKLSLQFKITVDVPSFVIEATDASGARTFNSVEELAKY
jgi:hypothetical protein